MKKEQSLGDRMKRYEAVTQLQLTPRSCAIIRIDGRAFHTFTKGCSKPFDMELIRAMIGSAQAVSEDMQGFKLGYVQSDEASFLITDFDELETQGWFDYNLQKIVSISASVMTAVFNQIVSVSSLPGSPMGSKLATFDSRAFIIPKDEVANYFLWRAKDWARNSIQMYCRSFFSHKELHNKTVSDMHDMLHDIGKNWTTDLEPMIKNGTFLIKNCFHYEVQPTYADISKLIEGLNIGV